MNVSQHKGKDNIRQISRYLLQGTALLTQTSSSKSRIFLRFLFYHHTEYAWGSYSQSTRYAKQLFTYWAAANFIQYSKKL